MLGFHTCLRQLSFTVYNNEKTNPQKRAKANNFKPELKHCFVTSIRIETTKEGAGISISKFTHQNYLPSGSYSQGDREPRYRGSYVTSLDFKHKKTPKPYGHRFSSVLDILSLSKPGNMTSSIVEACVHFKVSATAAITLLLCICLWSMRKLAWRKSTLLHPQTTVPSLKTLTGQSLP